MSCLTDSMTRKRDGSENRRVRERGGVKRERRESERERERNREKERGARERREREAREFQI